MRLRIVSDGTSFGTKLYDADTGEELAFGVRAVTWTVSGNTRMATATLEVRNVEVDVIAEDVELPAGVTA